MTMSSSNDRPRLRVDLDALAHNWRLVRKACAASVLGAVVKHDAYGLGIEAMAPALWALGGRDFWVATADEGLAVRQALSDHLPRADARIFVLNGLGAAAPADFAAYGLTPVLAGAHEAAALAGYAAHQGSHLPIAVHLDTGLTRLGFGEAELGHLQPGAALWQDARPQVWVTHLGRFHDPESPSCLRQRERFQRWTDQLPLAQRSIATSSSVFAGADWRLDHVRVGSALWGVSSSEMAAPALRPVAQLWAPVLRVADVPAGTEIGYMGCYTSGAPQRIATVGLGYADGLPFSLVNRGHLVLAGRRVPIVGGVAMGLVAVDVSALAPGEVQPGDWAEVYGEQQPLEALAADAGVAPNVLLTGTARLARREYVRAPTPVSGMREKAAS